MQEQNSGFLNSIPVVTRNLIIINVIALLAQQLLGDNILNTFYKYALLFPVQSGNFMPHQLVTYMFLHVDFWHMFFNMFAVFMFGRTLETVWGPKKFIVYYLLTGIGAGLTQLLVGYLSGSMAPTLGASGAVFGILLAFGMTFPNVKLIMIPIPIPIKAKWFVIGYGVLELVQGFNNNPNDNVAHFAHLGGLFFGLIIMLYWKQKYKKNNGHI